VSARFSVRLPLSARIWRGVLLAGLIGAASLAAFVALADAPLPAVWKQWHYSRAIELAPADSMRLVSVVVPEGVFRESRSWLPDLRVIDNQGQETAFAVRMRSGSTRAVSTPTTLLENSFAPGRYTQLVLDLGKKAPFHNAVEILTAQTDFIEWVSVEASDDAHLWRIVQPRAPFFQFRLQYREGANTIAYSENNAQYLRIHILDGEKQFSVAGATVFHKTVTQAERVALSVSFANGAPSAARRSAWIADLGAAGMPVSEVGFEVGPPAEFIRTVEVFASDDGQKWLRFAQGEIFRYYQEKVSQEQLVVAIPFGGARGRYWKVEVVNGNDAPLEAVTLQLSAVPRHIVFEQQPGRSYRLLYGQNRATAPEYDLERRLDGPQEDAAREGQVGPQEVNADWQDPRPWTEKHDIFLWLVLLAAVGMLGYAAVRSLRRSAGAPVD
jgi:Protein of unknown function (DUF3999)